MKPTLEEFRNDCRVSVLWQGRKFDWWCSADFDLEGNLLDFSEDGLPDPKEMNCAAMSRLRHPSGIEVEDMVFTFFAAGDEVVMDHRDDLRSEVERMYAKFSRRYDIMSAAGMSHEEIMETIGSI